MRYTRWSLRFTRGWDPCVRGGTHKFPRRACGHWLKPCYHCWSGYLFVMHYIVSVCRFVLPRGETLVFGEEPTSLLSISIALLLIWWSLLVYLVVSVLVLVLVLLLALLLLLVHHQCIIIVIVNTRPHGACLVFRRRRGCETEYDNVQLSEAGAARLSLVFRRRKGCEQNASPFSRQTYSAAQEY